MIPEPQRTYILELLNALGEAAGGFVLAGAQAMKFVLPGARATRDFDFVLDAILLREQQPDLANTLRQLGYEPIQGAWNFQFQKPIPNSPEVMRIEFMAPEELRRRNDIRVDIQHGVHARACAGGSIAIVEYDVHEISGRLPDGAEASATLRVVKSHSLVMMKLLAMDDRYRNVRGPAQAEHDRDEARIHAADIIAIMSTQPDPRAFQSAFESQFEFHPDLGERVREIAREYFEQDTSPGLLLYEEALRLPASDEVNASRTEIASELHRAQHVVVSLLAAGE